MSLSLFLSFIANRKRAKEREETATSALRSTMRGTALLIAVSLFASMAVYFAEKITVFISRNYIQPDSPVRRVLACSPVTATAAADSQQVYLGKII